MNEVTAYLLLGVALVVVAGLGGYAWSLWREVRRREAFRQDEVRRANENCLESLDAIAKAMLQEQVDLVEGALRCKVLLEIIDPILLEREPFRVFATVQARTAHLHTHSARKNLTPRQRMQEDRERIGIEDEHRQDVMDAAQAVIVFREKWPASLQ